jgi:hypothetical protein
VGDWEEGKKEKELYSCDNKVVYFLYTKANRFPSVHQQRASCVERGRIGDDQARRISRKNGDPPLIDIILFLADSG